MGRKFRFDILGIGTVAVDDFLHVAHYPEPDQKARVTSKSRKFGGLVGTALASAAVAGASCAFGGALGGDELSDALRSTFAELRIDYSLAITHADGCPTHSVIIVDDSRHTRNIFYYQQREFSMYEEFDPSVITGTRLLLIDQSARKAAEPASKLGIPVIADMEWPDRDDVDAFMACVDHLILPVSVGCAIVGTDDPKSVLRDLQKRKERACTAVTCGEKGCYYISSHTGEVVFFQKAFPISPIETNGCGDVFHGAYAASLAKGNDVPFSIRFASAAAAIYASRPSGWEYLPDYADIRSLCASQENMPEPCRE